MDNNTLLADIFRCLNTVIWERLAPYSFKIAGHIPQFAEHLFVAPQRQGTLPWQRSAMLDHFLQQAEPFWMLGSRSILRSSPWREQDENGREYTLDAMALCPGAARVLLLRELQGREFEERRLLALKARHPKKTRLTQQRQKDGE